MCWNNILHWLANPLRFSKSRRVPRSVLQRKLSMGVWYPNGFVTAYNMLLLSLVCSKIPMVNCRCWIPVCPFPQFRHIVFYLIGGCLGGNNIFLIEIAMLNFYIGIMLASKDILGALVWAPGTIPEIYGSWTTRGILQCCCWFHSKVCQFSPSSC